MRLCLEVFLGSMESVTLRPYGLDITSQDSAPTDLPIRAPYTLEPTLPIVGPPILLRHPIVITRTSGTGMLACFPSTTPFGLALGTD